MSTGATLDLPRTFCWTKYGTESGELVEEILGRKERERQANGGIFLWGIGNSVRPGVRELVRREKEPLVVFSPMRSKPKRIDEEPGTVLAWTRARTCSGTEWKIPVASSVLSRADTEGGLLKRTHYALVCKSDKPLASAGTTNHLAFGALSNLVSGAPIGHSQVTSVVSLSGENSGPTYAVSFVARLVYPFFVELLEPIACQGPKCGATALTTNLRPEQSELHLAA